jgi:hypothetical protein
MFIAYVLFYFLTPHPLFRSMAQKESQHKELVDSLHGQLAQVQRAHDELNTLSRDQVGGKID